MKRGKKTGFGDRDKERHHELIIFNRNNVAHYADENMDNNGITVSFTSQIFH